jgi:AbrB family looped-hinge helix DNA binding protein
LTTRSALWHDCGTATETEVTMHIEHAKLGEDGRLVIPAALRKELGLHPGDTIVIESDGDSLLLRGYERVLQEVQGAFAGCRVPGADAADELIGERRAEAASERKGES